MAVIRLDTRPNHPFPANHVETQFVSRPPRKRIYEEPLGSTVPLPEWMKLIHRCKQLSNLASELDPTEPTEQIRPMQPLEDPFCLVLEEAGGP